MVNTLRVCVVSPLYHPHLGGVGRQAVALTEKLYQSGVQVFVLCRNIHGLPEWKSAEGISVRALRTLGSHRHDLEEKTLRNFLVSFSFCIRLLGALIRSRKEYDIVHFHGASLPLIFNVIPLKLMRKKIIAKVAGAKMKIEAGSFLGTYVFIGHIFISILKRVDAFVAISSEIREDLIRDGFESKAIREIPNFIMPDQFYPLTNPSEKKQLRKDIGISEESLVLTFSGRLVKRKRVDVLLRAIADAVKSRPDIIVIILGHGEMKEDLERLAAELGIQKNMMFRSFVRNIRDYLHITDIFVFPSEKEGMPNAVLEAMACGLPVIASRIGGVVDVIRDRKNGLLVEPRDPDGLRDAILELCEKQELRTSLAEEACATIRDNFSAETVVKKYLELYRKICRED
jgi:glycosyltransferase involved in cell wall biosynthesis